MSSLEDEIKNLKISTTSTSTSTSTNIKIDRANEIFDAAISAANIKFIATYLNPLKKDDAIKSLRYEFAVAEDAYKAAITAAYDFPSK
jgi:hypothetical protein